MPFDSVHMGLSLHSQVTLLGDLSALCGAISIIGYLEVGQRLRAWMPIFLYACPVTGALETSCCTCAAFVHKVADKGSKYCRSPEQLQVLQLFC